MLKKIAIALMLIIPMGITAQTLKFGHIASQEVLVLMPEYNKAMGEMEALQKKFSEELARYDEEFQKKYQEFQQANAEGNLPQNIQERRQKELQEIMERSEQFREEAYQTIQNASSELMAPIMQKLNNTIKEVGEAEGVIYVFDISRTAIPYINESMSTDMSVKVKAKLGI